MICNLVAKSKRCRFASILLACAVLPAMFAQVRNTTQSAMNNGAQVRRRLKAETNKRSIVEVERFCTSAECLAALDNLRVANERIRDLQVSDDFEAEISADQAFGTALREFIRTFRDQYPADDHRFDNIEPAISNLQSSLAQTNVRTGAVRLVPMANIASNPGAAQFSILRIPSPSPACSGSGCQHPFKYQVCVQLAFVAGVACGNAVSYACDAACVFGTPPVIDAACVLLCTAAGVYACATYVVNPMIQSCNSDYPGCG